MKGILFESNTSENRERRHATHEICRTYSRTPSKGHFKKLRNIFSFCGKDVRMEYGFHCDYGNKISIGERSYFNINCTILDGGLVIIGDDVLIGPNVQILTINHDVNAQSRLDKKTYVQDIKIGNNVWIGAGAIILAGSIIEDNVVVGAGSVVSGRLHDGYLYAGTPLKKIKKT
ncbi:MAG: DapH/DapD/GlmU-related protein [Kangiellaceae bacterium]